MTDYRSKGDKMTEWEGKLEAFEEDFNTLLNKHNLIIKSSYGASTLVIKDRSNYETIGSISGYIKNNETYFYNGKVECLVNSQEDLNSSSKEANDYILSCEWWSEVESPFAKININSSQEECDLDEDEGILYEE